MTRARIAPAPAAGLAMAALVAAVVAVLMPAPADARNPRKELRKVWEAGSAGGGNWAVVVRPLGETDDDAAFEAEATLRLLPASTAKLFTAWTAAHVLPQDTTFATGWVCDCQRRAGSASLDGIFALFGGGAPGLFSRARGDSLDPDPAPGVSALDSLARMVRDWGVDSLVGEIRVENSLYRADSLGAGWQWDDLDEWYAAPVTALALDDNTEERQAGQRAAVHSPGSYAVARFREALGRAGVAFREVRGGARPGCDAPKSDTARFGELRWPPLRNVYHPMLARSQNLRAEMLLRDLGEARRRSASARSGLDVVGNALAAIGLGVPADVRLVDGSGLSRLNLATADALARVLTDAWTRARDGEQGMQALLDGLARPGQRGTLIRRFTADPWSALPAGWLRAKTGSMDGVDALAAIVQPDSERAYVVISLRNRFPETHSDAREWEERLIRVLVEE
ncbi:MAG: D-alanyl-D-alanine carboxypeptidase [Candidatus Eisenbacteria bacterium]|nr:D-alanyl-D-alanine carboxypeptidase [Candidatus Eisenbacteria bacterium]